MTEALDRLVPLSRPGGPTPTTPVVRLPDHPVVGLPEHEIADMAVDGPEVSIARDGRSSVRFWHHAPHADAVALVANGWWRPHPENACDLTRVAGGWWTIAVEVPDRWQVTHGFVEHRGPQPPAWWSTDLRSLGRPVLHGPDARVLRLPAVERPWLPGTPTDEPMVWEDAPARWPCWTWTSGGEGELPLLVITDGQVHVERHATHRLLQAAVDEGILPPLAAVFVDSGQDRGGDLGVPGGQSRWIGAELVPQLRRAWPGRGRLTEDPHRTIVVGSSFGGLTALFTVARAPGVLGSAIAQSVSLWRYPEGALTGPLLTAGRAHPLRLRLRAGTDEGLVPGVRRLATDLAAGGVDAHFEAHPGGHDWAWWVPGLVDDAAELLAATPRTS